MRDLNEKGSVPFFPFSGIEFQIHSAQSVNLDFAHVVDLGQATGLEDGGLWVCWVGFQLGDPLW